MDKEKRKAQKLGKKNGKTEKMQMTKKRKKEKGETENENERGKTEEWIKGKKRL